MGARKITAGPIDIELVSSARGFAVVLLTALDNLPISSSSNLLLSIPGYTLRALPGVGNRPPAAGTAQPQLLKYYPGTTDWWTLDSTNSPNPQKPSGDMNGGWQPTFMERVEAYVTLRTTATSVMVAALDGAGEVLAALPPSEVQLVNGGVRMHLNGEGQRQSAWFAITAVQ
jgi:hypothetical protein